MIYFDVTKAGPRRHRSGLTRVSGRLRDCLADTAVDAAWDEGLRDLKSWTPVSLRADDWFLTTELFSEAERPGFSTFLASFVVP